MTSGSQDFFVILVISLTGLLVPVHSLLLLLVSTDRIDREWGCQLQLLTFYTLNVLFLNSAYFNVTFRAVLIRMPQHGLVHQGKT